MISEAEYNQALAEQGGGCKICGNPPGSVSLHVDHDHAIEKWKIESERVSGGWKAYPKGRAGRLDFEEISRLKTDALRKVRARLKRLSVRGILCWHDNAGLKKFSDDAYRLQNAAEYLNEYYSFLNNERADRNGFGQ